MVRRRFLAVMGLLGAGGVMSLSARTRDGEAPQTGARRTVRYLVEGFTCITCALGLETLLRRERGVLSAKADYPSTTVVIEYDPAVIDDRHLQAFVQDAGFRAVKVPG